MNIQLNWRELGRAFNLRSMIRFMPQGLLAMVACLTVAWLVYRLSGLTALLETPSFVWHEPNSQSAAEVIAQQHWFGKARLAAPPRLQVLGVFAPLTAGQEGFALVEEAGQIRPFFSAKKHHSGWTLSRIIPSGIILQKDEREVFLPLSLRNTPLSPLAAPHLAKRPGLLTHRPHAMIPDEDQSDEDDE